MTREKQIAIRLELERISGWAQRTADDIDPQRKRSAKNELDNSLIKVLDQIAAKAQWGLTMLRIEERLAQAEKDGS
jgi:hypothetical protein